MDRPWEAEFVVDAALAGRLVRTQSGLAADRVEPLGAGWDMTVFLVDDAWAFRFPRRPFGREALERECTLLPRLAPALPLPVPRPAHFGEPTPEFPCRFYGHELLAGRTACRAALSEAERTALARPLGEFLRALHALPADGVEGDTLGRMDVEKRLPWTRARLDAASAAGLVDSPAPWLPILERIPRGARPQRLCHGDLYVRHLVVDGEARLTGVLDWGDCHFGDPAVDLMLAATFLPADAEADFAEAYGGIDDDSWRLARLRALGHTCSTAIYASETDDAPLLRESRRALGRLAAR